MRSFQLARWCIQLCSLMWFAACGPTELETNIRSAGQAAFSQIGIFSVEDVNANEGEPTTLTISRLCVDDNTEAVALEVDWGDGSPLTNVELDVLGAVDPVNCGPGFFVVCNSAAPAGLDGNCSLTHTYGDNGAATQVVARVSQGAVETQQSSSITINNVAPTLMNDARLGVPIEGQLATFTVDVFDPGTESDEIATVVWEFAAADVDVEGPHRITCDCSQIPNCDDGSIEPLCNLGTPRTITRESRYIQQGTFNPSITVTDKDGGTQTANFGAPISIFNDVPVVQLNHVDGGFNNPMTNATFVDGACLIIEEGSLYTIDADIGDPGTDGLDITWDFDDGDVFIGSGMVTDTSYPDVEDVNPADILMPTHAWDEGIYNGFNLSVLDSDSGSKTATACVQAEDVDPIINSLDVRVNGVLVAGEIDEGSIIEVTANVRSGAEIEAFDPISTISWEINGVALSVAIPAELEIISGCQNTDLTCEVRLRDADIQNTYTFDIEVRDEDSTRRSDDPTLMLSREVVINNVPPEISSIQLSDRSILEGGCATAEVSFNDPAGELDGQDYTITLNWGDGSPVSMLTTAAPGTIGPTECHVFPDNNVCPPGQQAGVGLCVVEAIVCEVGGTLCSAPVQTTIAVENGPPSVEMITPTEGFELVEGATLNLVGSFTDPGASADDTFDFSFDGNFDNGQSLTGAGILHSVGQVSASLTPAYTNVNAGAVLNDTITLRVSDDEGISGTDQVNVRVRDAVPQIDGLQVALIPTDAEPARAEVRIIASAETNADLLSSITIDFGDGEGPETITGGVTGIGSAGTGELTITQAQPYARDGQFDVRVEVCDEDGCVSETRSVTVRNEPPMITGVSPNGPIIREEGESFQVEVFASDAQSDLGTLTLQCDFDGTGPGAPTSQSMTNVNGTAVASCTSSCTEIGTRSMVVTVEDDSGAVSAPTTIQITCDNVAPTVLSVFNTGPVNVNEAVTIVALISQNTGDNISHTFNFECDANSLAEVGDDDFSEPRPGPLASQTQITSYDRVGTYGVCYRACDDDNAANSCAYGFTEVVVQSSTPSTIRVTPNVIDEGDRAVIDVSPNGVGPYNVSLDVNADGDFSDPEDQVLNNCDPCSFDVLFPQNTPGGGEISMAVNIVDLGAATVTESAANISVRNVAPTGSLMFVDAQAINSTTEATYIEKDDILIQVIGDDPGVQDVLMITLVSGPAGMMLDGTSNTLSWRPDYNAIGRVEDIELLIEDDDGGRSTLRFDLNILMIDTNDNDISDCFEDDQNNGVIDPFDACENLFEEGECDADRDRDGENDCIDPNPDDYDGPSTPSIIAPTTCTTDTSPSLIVANATSNRDLPISYRFTVLSNTGEILWESDAIPEGESITRVDVPTGLLGSGDYRFTVVAEDALISGTPTAESTFLIRSDCNDPTASICGDGLVEGREECDDAGESETCDADCSFAICGDSVANTTAGEACDDGGESVTCNINCTLVMCGDELLNTAAGEACDDGGESTTCDVDCTRSECGDGIVNVAAGETCDASGEAADCDLDCTAVSCGDGLVNIAAGEECEQSMMGAPCSGTCQLIQENPDCGDGITNGADDCDDAGESATCNRNCTTAVCGDGTLNRTAGEECDDAGESATCDGDCTLAICGDGVWNELVEACDPFAVVDGELMICNLDCTASTCGDGLLDTQSNEVCDDGGETARCNIDCTAAICGDGVLNETAGEECDDGNLVPFDGCATNCTVDERENDDDDRDFNRAPIGLSLIGPDQEIVTEVPITLEVTEAEDPEGDSVTYVFEYGTDPSFAGATREGRDETNLRLPDDFVEDDQRVYWRVYAVDEDGNRTDWVIGAFSVNLENDRPNGLHIIYPPDLSSFTRSPEYFEVGNAIDFDDDELTYRFVLCGEPQCNNVIIESEPIDEGIETTIWRPDLRELDDATYYWQVEVRDTQNTTQTRAAEFSVSQTGGVIELTGSGCDCRTADASVSLYVGLLMWGWCRRRRRL